MRLILRLNCFLIVFLYGNEIYRFYTNVVHIFNRHSSGSSSWIAQFLQTASVSRRQEIFKFRFTRDTVVSKIDSLLTPTWSVDVTINGFSLYPFELRCLEQKPTKNSDCIDQTHSNRIPRKSLHFSTCKNQMILCIFVGLFFFFKSILSITLTLSAP